MEAASRVAKELAGVLSTQDPEQVTIPDMVIAIAATLGATARALLEVGYRKEGASRVEYHRKKILEVLADIRQDVETFTPEAARKAETLEEVLG